jgi:hypothetical protein
LFKLSEASIGSDLFVTQFFAGTTGKYTTSGGTVNAADLLLRTAPATFSFWPASIHLR